MGVPAPPGRFDRLIVAFLVLAGIAALTLASTVAMASDLRMVLGLSVVVLVCLAWLVVMLSRQRRTVASRQATLATLHATEARLAAVLDHVPDLVSARDLEGRHLFVNRAYARFFGTGQTDLRGRSDREIHPAEVAELFAANDRAALSGGPRRFEETLPGPDGRPHTFETARVPLLDDAGRQVGVCAIATDVTERREAESREDGRPDAASTQDRADFVASMSHELRTPLNSVIGMTSLLLDTHLDAEQRTQAEAIHRSGETLLSLIDDIVDYSRIQAGRLRLDAADGPLEQIVEEAIDAVAPLAAARSVELVHRIDPTAPVGIHADGGRIRQVLVNLLRLAVEETEGGALTLGIAATPASEGRIQLVVDVEGPGFRIAEDRRERVARLLERPEAPAGRRITAQDLSLAIARALVHVMEGEIVLRTDAEKRSSLRATLLVRPVAGEVPAARANSPTRLSGLHVLLLEENAASRRAIESYASALGMVVRSVDDAAEARALLESGADFDVAIVDAHLAGTRAGTRAADDLRAVRPRGTLAIVASTGLGRRPSSALAARVGFAGTIAKPVRPLSLRRTLESALDPERRTAAASPNGAAPSSPRIRVLLAEDDPVNQAVVVPMLAKLGCRPDVARSGHEVLSALERSDYDLVLMDVQMSGMDGISTTRVIREKWPRERQPSIVAMTASAAHEDEMRCREAGMDGFLSKPVDLECLQRALARVERRPDPPPPPLDEVAFARLRALERDAPGVLKEVVDLYLADTPTRIAAMREAAGRGDAEALAPLAHSLKGSSGYLGAREIESLCSEIEGLVRSGHPQEAIAKLPPLEGALERVRAALATD